VAKEDFLGSCEGVVERPWLVLDSQYSVLFGIKKQNKQSHLIGPPFPAFKTHFSTTPGWYILGALIEIFLSDGCG